MARSRWLLFICHVCFSNLTFIEWGVIFQSRFFTSLFFGILTHSSDSDTAFFYVDSRFFRTLQVLLLYGLYNNHFTRRNGSGFGVNRVIPRIFSFRPFCLFMFLSLWIRNSLRSVINRSYRVGKFLHTSFNPFVDWTITGQSTTRTFISPTFVMALFLMRPFDSVRNGLEVFGFFCTLFTCFYRPLLGKFYF